MGAQSSSVGDESSVPTYVDGFYVTDGHATLFGRNAVGGRVNVVTRTPSETPKLEASLGYDNLETVYGQFYVTGGLVDDVSADLAIAVRDRGRATASTSRRATTCSAPTAPRSAATWFRRLRDGPSAFRSGSDWIERRDLPKRSQ